MEQVTEQGIQEQLNTGAELTKEETAFVMSTPPDGPIPAADDSDEEVDFSEAEDVGEKPSEKKQASGTKDEDAEKPGEKKGDEPAEAEKKADTEGKEKTTEEPAPEKKDEKTVEEGTLHGKIERELDKPDGQEDLGDFSSREKGLFYEMKKARQRAQKAEEDRDALMFEKVREAKMKQEKPKEEAKPEEDDEDLFGKDADPEDFPTIGKLREISKKANEKQTEANKARARAITLRLSEIGARDIVEARREMGKDAPDYDEVMGLAPVIIEGNEEYKQKIAEAYHKGKNSALVMYDLIRRDQKFNALFKPTKEAPKPPEKKEASEEGKKTLEKINANEKKPRTSGTSGAGGGPGDTEYTVEQLLNMTPEQFRKVPRDVRQKFLYNV